MLIYSYCISIDNSYKLIDICYIRHKINLFRKFIQNKQKFKYKFKRK